MVWFIIILLIWLILGASGFIFWWTKDNDFVVADVPITLFAMFAGPFAWAIGFFIHGLNKEKILLKKRNKE